MTLPRRTRPVVDVSELPDVVFGPADLLWWGTLGFVVIEGFTLVLCAAVYLYLQQNYSSWPPQGTPRPSVVVPTLQMVSMLASLVVARRTEIASKHFHFEGVKWGLTLLALLCALFVGLRLWELLVSLNVKWDTNAYGSAQWLVLGAHGSLLIVQLVEVAGSALIFWIAPVERKHFSDGADAAFYWYFMVLAWVPLYVLCFWMPRWT